MVTLQMIRNQSTGTKILVGDPHQVNGIPLFIAALFKN